MSLKDLHSPLQNLLETSTFIHFFYFSKWMRCAIFQINTKLLVTYWNINIFTQEILYPSIIWKKLALSIANAFLKHPLFTTFSLFLKGSEVCNISNKSWLPNNSANKIFLHKKPYTPPLLQKNLRSPCQNLWEISTFYYIFTSFDSEWGVQYYK